MTGSEDSTSCTAEVARGGNLQLCVNHRTHPQNSAQTVRLESAVWFNGADKLVGCGPTRCNSFKPNVNTSEPWAKCLTMASVTENGTVSYLIRVDPDTSYPATAPASTMFTFTVRVVDTSKSQQACSICGPLYVVATYIRTYVHMYVCTYVGSNTQYVGLLHVRVGVREWSGH